MNVLTKTRSVCDDLLQTLYACMAMTTRENKDAMREMGIQNRNVYYGIEPEPKEPVQVCACDRLNQPQLLTVAELQERKKNIKKAIKQAKQRRKQESVNTFLN